MHLVQGTGVTVAKPAVREERGARLVARQRREGPTESEERASPVSCFPRHPGEMEMVDRVVPRQTDRWPPAGSATPGAAPEEEVRTAIFMVAEVAATGVAGPEIRVRAGLAAASDPPEACSRSRPMVAPSGRTEEVDRSRSRTNRAHRRRRHQRQSLPLWSPPRTQLQWSRPTRADSRTQPTTAARAIFWTFCDAGTATCAPRSSCTPMIPQVFVS